jgi:4a-hydroxytetrahydrobiopterin dehydratase
MEKLSPDQINEYLAGVPQWSLNGELLQRTFRFDDFNAAIAFVNRLRDLAEGMQHHPDIMIRNDKVTLTLTTHDAGGLTEKDFAFAQAAEGCVPAEKT